MLHHAGVFCNAEQYDEAISAQDQPSLVQCEENVKPAFKVLQRLVRHRPAAIRNVFAGNRFECCNRCKASTRTGGGIDWCLSPIAQSG